MAATEQVWLRGQWTLATLPTPGRYPLRAAWVVVNGTAQPYYSNGAEWLALSLESFNVENPLPVIIGDPWDVLLGRVTGEYIVSKFGRNPDVDAAEDIWGGGGDYAGFPTGTAEQFTVFSSSVNDAAAGTGARTLRVFYMDSNYTFVDSNGALRYFDVTLNGTTTVNTGVTGMRAWRGVVLTSGSGGTNAGTLTCRWITTTSAVFFAMPIGVAQSNTAAFTIPAGYTGYLRRWHCSMDDSTTNSAQMALKTRTFNSNTFRLIRPFVVATTKDYNEEMYGAEVMTEKTDFVFRATAVTNANGVINVSYDIHLVAN